MSPGARTFVEVEARDREVAEATARALPAGLDADLVDGGVELRPVDGDPDRARRVWKAAYATEFALQRGAAERAGHMRALLG